MKLMSRRSVIRGSLGLAATGVLARPHIANAAAATATVWQVQGFVPEEDAAFRKTVADYEKASGNKIDLSIMPFTALNQKAISALTSGDVPDLIFHDAPATILPQNAWDDKLVDVSDIVEAYRSQAQRDRDAELQLLQQRHEAARLLPCAGQAGVRAVPYLGRPGQQGRLQAVGRAEDLGRVLGLLQADAEGAARQGDAQALCHGPADHHRRTERRQRPVHAFHDRQRRRRTSSPGTASCTPTIRRCARRRSGRSTT